jgi:hypothetical protein
LQLTASISDEYQRSSAYTGLATVEWQAGARREAQRDFNIAGTILDQMPESSLTNLNRQGITIARATASDFDGAREHMCHCDVAQETVSSGLALMTQCSQRDSEDAPSVDKRAIALRARNWR